MKIEIIPSASNLPRREGWMRLTEKDFNHYESFFAKHPDIKPESVDEIYTKGVLEIVPMPAIIVRHLDWLLKTDGKLIVDFCFPNSPFYGEYNNLYTVRYFLSQSFSNNIKLTNSNFSNHSHLEYTKYKSCLPNDDSINAWTFGICSNGTNVENVLAIISQLNSLNIPLCQIIVCGPPINENLPSNVIVVDDSPIYAVGDNRFPIGKKKNLIVEHALYNNVVIMHDRYTFHADWYKNMIRWGNYFDMLAFPVLDVDNPELHLCDWQCADYYHPRKELNQVIHALPYTMYNEYAYINGGIFMCKKHIYNEMRMSTKLHWDEMEDIDFSRRMMLYGYLISFDINNHIFSSTRRLHPIGKPDIYPPKMTFGRIISNKRQYYYHISHDRKEYYAFIHARKRYLIDAIDLKCFIYRALSFLRKRFRFK